MAVRQVTETDSLDNEYRIYRLQNRIYDLAMSLDNTSSDSENNEDSEHAN